MEDHELIWLGTTRAQCQCGMDFTMAEDDCKGKTNDELRDVLMDRHSDHIGAQEMAR